MDRPIGFRSIPMPPTLRFTRGNRRRSRGTALIWLIVTMVATIGMVSLAVDVGEAQLAKTQLRAAADAAARYGVTGLYNNTAVALATAAAADNNVNGNPVVLQPSDVQIGIWNSTSKTFTATNVNPNAVQVTARLSATRGTAVATSWASILGFNSVDETAVSIAIYVTGDSSFVSVPGGSDPWLAGMPGGTTANYTNQGWTDSAPNNSPIQASGITLTSGSVLNFDFSGSVSYFPGYSPYGCDGNPNYTGDNYWAASNGGGSEHGIANLTAPICSIIGVFLNDTEPDLPGSGSVPPALDFSSASSRDFATLSPLLKQPFFIGDGLRADGITPQNFVVPAGATRLYIGVMDFQQWSDNTGSMSSLVTHPNSITIVK
jgi:Flp pilus assembly protein TadG